jgi:hypothetical protein
LNQRYQKLSGIVAGPAGDLSSRRSCVAIASSQSAVGGRTYQLAGQVNGDRITGTVDVPGGKLPFSASKRHPERQSDGNESQ